VRQPGPLVLNTSLEKVTKVILTPDQDLIYSCPGMHFVGPGYFAFSGVRSPPENAKYPGPKKCILGHE
jgi:hypothetical protein